MCDVLCDVTCDASASLNCFASCVVCRVRATVARGSAPLVRRLAEKRYVMDEAGVRNLNGMATRPSTFYDNGLCMNGSIR